MAKMKKCKACGKEIAKSAKSCPSCGAKNGMPTIVKFLIVFVIIILCVVGCVNSCSNAVDDSIKETANSYKDVNGKTSFKKGETFENKYEKITMTEVNTEFKDYDEYFEPDDGKKYVMIKFEVENIDEESDEIYISSLEFSAYADGVAVDEGYVGNDKYNDLSATIGKGKKAVGYIFYEVPKDAKEITLEYNADFWTDGNQIEFVVAE